MSELKIHLQLEDCEVREDVILFAAKLMVEVVLEDANVGRVVSVYVRDKMIRYRS